MPDQEALSLLQKYLPNRGTYESEDTLQEIIDKLGCLALAIDQAGCYMQHQQLSGRRFLKHYVKQRRAVLQQVPYEWEYNRDETALSVFTTWKLSLSCLSGSEDAVKQKENFLAIAGFFSPANIQENLFRDYTAKADTRNT